MTAPRIVPPVPPTENHRFAGGTGCEVETVGIEPTKGSPRADRHVFGSVEPTFGDLLCGWALTLRGFCEQHDLSDVRVTQADGAVLIYRVGQGLTVLADGRKLEVPEAALDEQRWVAVDA